MKKPQVKTESEWLTSSDPNPMLMALRGRRKYRKLRLFAVECCRFIQPDLPDERSQRTIEVAERYADGEVDHQDLELARLAAQDAHLESFRKRGKIGSCLEWACVFVADPAEFHAARTVSWMAATARQDGGTTAANLPVQANMLRDIFGNVFRPFTVDPSWLTEDVVTLAEAIYKVRSFDRLPELAESLEEAGCQDAEILDHCRQTGPHVRGCWVVDLLLGKE